jgi:AcrR family transcriptional regulator
MNDCCEHAFNVNFAPSLVSLPVMPKARAKLTPRKQPRQQRSAATVAAIIQAAAYIFRKRGYAATTTNAIAERAGVNIASLYQYFPNKEAILGALLRRHADQANQAVTQVMAEHRGKGLAANVRAIAKSVQAIHAIEPELHEIFTVDATRLGFQPFALEHEPVFEQARAQFIRESKLRDPALALWIVETCVRAAFHQAFAERREQANSDLLVDEIVRLIVPFLKG